MNSVRLEDQPKRDKKRKEYPIARNEQIVDMILKENL